MIKIIESSSLEDYLKNEKNLQKDNDLEDSVRKIIQAVKDNGNQSLITFINKYEKKDLTNIDEILNISLIKMFLISSNI